MMSKLLTAQPTVKAIIKFEPYRDGSRVLNGGRGSYTRVERLYCKTEALGAHFDVFYIFSITFCKSWPCNLQTFQSGSYNQVLPNSFLLKSTLSQKKLVGQMLYLPEHALSTRAA